MLWQPVRNEGRVPCDGPSQEDDFLERIKAVREKTGRETVEENTRKDGRLKNLGIRIRNNTDQ